MNNKITKPEVYTVGTTVVVLDNEEEINDGECLFKPGDILTVVSVYDDRCGISYFFEGSNWRLPHYCVKKIITVELTLEQIEKKLGYPHGVLKIIK